MVDMSKALVCLDNVYCIAFGHKRGHLTVWDCFSQKWVYADDIIDIAVEKPCVRCGKMPTPEGHDACLGYIPGVESACCGHGVTEPILIRRQNGD